jgi:hypothetical protein
LGGVRLLKADQGYDWRATTLPLHADLASGFQFFQRSAFALRGDEVQLEYYPDGYPKLPECLDRRALMVAL